MITIQTVVSNRPSVREDGFVLIRVSDLEDCSLRKALPSSAKGNLDTNMAYLGVKENKPFRKVHVQARRTRTQAFALKKLPEKFSTQTRTDERPVDWMQQELQKSHERSMPYTIVYFGEYESPWAYKILHAGDLRERYQQMPGINTPYVYFSNNQGSPTPMHLEDYGWGSMNLLVDKAAKVWLSVPRSDASRLENFARQDNADAKGCSQFVRHLGLLFYPEELEKAQIKFQVVQQPAGYTVYTDPGAYHQVLNEGPNGQRQSIATFPVRNLSRNNVNFVRPEPNMPGGDLAREVDVCL